jgi:hypothetical protein
LLLEECRVANFIEEVDEEVRRDRMETLWKRFSPFAIGAVVLLLLAVGGHQAWKAWQADKAAAAGSAFSAALNQAQAGKAAEAATALADLAKTAPKGYAQLARFQQAAVLIEAKDIPGAIAVYDALAADAAIEPRLRDLARYLAAYHGFDSLQPDQLRQRLAGLASDSPWAVNAREMLALVELKAGDRDAARKQLTTLADDPLVPAGLRGRAAELLAALGGPVQ